MQRTPGTFWTYRRPFTVDGLDGLVLIETTMKALHSRLFLGGREVAQDETPTHGVAAARTHQLAAPLPDGRMLEVDAGMIGWWTVGIVVRAGGRIVHESHPGRTIAYPMSQERLARTESMDMSVFKRNKVPIAVDVALGLLFFAVAKLTDLPTAAIVGAFAGLALVLAQRFVKTDLIGGMALFGVVMLLVSAGLALAFQDDSAVKLRSTIIGLVGAAAFLTDGLFGGRWLGRGMARYLPYTDIIHGRLAIGMGLLGLVMAGLNWLVARMFSTEIWLFYSTFVDFALVVGLIFIVYRYARAQPPFHRRRGAV